MINKNQFSIKNTKKILHKVGKRWVVISAVLLGIAAGGAAVNTPTTHAAVNNNQARVTQNSGNAQRAHHLPRLNASQANDLQNQAVNSVVNNVSTLKARAMTTWDNAWNQAVTSDVEQTSDMAAKMNRLSHLGSYVASDEQQQISTYGMNSAYGHMPNGQSNAAYTNYATASGAMINDVTSMANGMITSAEHSMKVSNHARQVANAPIHSMHASVHAKKADVAKVSAQSVSDQAKYDSAWAVRNGANDPAKRVSAAKSTAASVHADHMSARAHASKVASHTAMLKRKASNAVARRDHAASRSAAQDKSSADQTNYNFAKSLQAGQNDPAKSVSAAKSTAASVHADHMSARAHASKVASHTAMLKRKASNAVVRSDHAASRAATQAKSSADQTNHDFAKSLQAGQNDPAKRVSSAKSTAASVHADHMSARAHASKVASHTAMLKRKASNAVVRSAHAASRAAAQTKSSADQTQHDFAKSLQSGQNDPAKSVSAAKSTAASVHADHMSARAHASKVASHTAMLKRKASNTAVRSDHAASRAAAQAKSSADQTNHDFAKSLRSGQNDPAKSVSAAKSTAASVHADHMSARAHASKVASHTAMLKRKASNAVVRSDHAASRAATQAKSSADQTQYDFAKSLRSGQNDPAKLAHARSLSASQALVNKRAAASADQSIATSVLNSVKASVSQANVKRARVAASVADQKIAQSYQASVSASVAQANEQKAKAAQKSADASIASQNVAQASAKAKSDGQSLANSAASSADQSIAASEANSVKTSVTAANQAKAQAAASQADKGIESSIATSAAKSADQSLDDSIATSYATSADDSIATSQVTSMDHSISASVSNSVAQSTSASTAKSVASSAASVKSSANSAAAAGDFNPNNLSLNQLGDLGTIGYCYDNQGNEYYSPNIASLNYSMSGNEIYVKLAKGNVTVDTGFSF